MSNNSDERFCPNCGGLCPEHARFCPSCACSLSNCNPLPVIENAEIVLPPTAEKSTDATSPVMVQQMQVSTGARKNMLKLTEDSIVLVKDLGMRPALTSAIPYSDIAKIDIFKVGFQSYFQVLRPGETPPPQTLKALNEHTGSLPIFNNMLLTLELFERLRTACPAASFTSWATPDLVKQNAKKNKAVLIKWGVIIVLVIIGVSRYNHGPTPIPQNSSSSPQTTAKSHPAAPEATTAAAPTPVESTPQQSEATIKISAIDLARSYKNNEVAADEKYKDRIVEVSGTIDNIGKDIMDTPYVTLHGSGGEYSFDSPQFMFPGEEQKNILTKLSKKQKVTICGRVSGKVITSVIIDDCWVSEY